MQVYQVFKTAEARLQANILMVEAILHRINIQLEFVKRVANTMEDEHCRIHLGIMEMLQRQLSTATTKIESVVKMGIDSNLGKTRYLMVRDSLDGTIVQLERWQRIFDPTWYLILRIGDKVIDAELAKPLDLPSSFLSPSASTPTSSQTLPPARKLRYSLAKASDTDVHVSLAAEGLDWDNATEILFSNTRMIRRVGQTQRTFIVDTILCTPELDVTKTRADATTLARKLGQIDPDTFGLLSCHGLVKRRHADNTRRLASINMIFHMPVASHDEPTSLRHHLVQDTRCSLTRILDVARQLANAISFVHTCDFVHKNIRPETVLVFKDQTASSSTWSTYLVGFDSFRSINFQTTRTGDAAWERNLYRHPSRQGIFARDAYSMQHDVYSLGVCLLELGLWESFLQYVPVDGDSGSSACLPSETLGLRPNDFETCEASQAYEKIKDHLVELARTRLPPLMGDQYTAVVLTCLTCLDQGNEDFGDEQDMCDDDGILIGVRFIEKVLLKLDAMSL